MSEVLLLLGTFTGAAFFTYAMFKLRIINQDDL